MATQQPIEITLVVATVLERLGVDYLVGGSLATSLHGIPRATLDVDVIADLRMAHLEDFAAALQADFYVDPDMVKDAIRRRSSFNILHLATMFKVDVFVVGADELLSSEMSRKQRVRVRDEPPSDLFVASPEDMVLQKLIWYRDGGMVSDRQWGDIIGVIRTQGERLDLGYLRLWASRKELVHLLDRALAEAGITDKV